jgi:hypothetical protein
VSPKGLENTKIYKRISWHYFLSPFLGHKEADKLDIAVIGSHGDSREDN